ncbi:hypothetical protein [Variovorax sp. ZT4R33]|uniref:hypothetical protein n=1 Tax=Variovorax sp. ZT4R33 TaxID=3443743 RepID=UPI003F459733
MSTSGAADLQRWRPPPVHRVLSTGLLLEGSHLNKVWRGMVQRFGTTEAAVPHILKWTDKKEVLAAELACSLAGKALKLQVPAGVLALAEKGDLPGLPNRVRGASTDLVMCFASELQWPDDAFARPVHSDAAEERIWQQLCDTPQGPSGAVWDELVANEDRHCENVVFDGHRWWLIDHEHTLPSVAKVMKRFAEHVIRQSLIDHVAKENVLAAEVVRRRSKDHQMNTLPPAWASLRVRLQWLADQAQNWHTGMDQVDTVLMMTHVYLRSIDLRLPALAMHLQKRLEQPEKVSLWTSYSKPRQPVPSKATPRRPA